MMGSWLRLGLGLGAALLIGVAGGCDDGEAAPDGSGGSGGSSATGGTTSDGGHSTSSGTGGSGTGGDAGQPPFECEPAAVSSPQLAGLMLFDPAAPHPGDTLTVIVRTTNGTPPNQAPSLQLQAEGAAGVTVEEVAMTAGGGDTYYYFAVPNVQLGDVCLLGLIAGVTPEISGRVTVTPRPPGPPVTGGVYKVIQNHQWTCAEQPEWGNEIHVYVQDEQGNGVPNAVIDINYADSTDPGSIYNDGSNIPDTVTTDGGGYFLGYNSWPISDNGLLVFQLSVAGEPSDIATEITTGWWETNDDGCNYCNEFAKNVWGHLPARSGGHRDLHGGHRSRRAVRLCAARSHPPPSGLSGLLAGRVAGEPALAA